MINIISEDRYVIEREIFEPKVFLNNHEVGYIYQHPYANLLLRDLAAKLTVYTCLKLKSPVEQFRPTLDDSVESTLACVKKIVAADHVADAFDPHDR